MPASGRSVILLQKGNWKKQKEGRACPAAARELPLHLVACEVSPRVAALQAAARRLAQRKAHFKFRMRAVHYFQSARYLTDKRGAESTPREYLH